MDDPTGGDKLTEFVAKSALDRFRNGERVVNVPEELDFRIHLVHVLAASTGTS